METRISKLPLIVTVVVLAVFNLQISNGFAQSIQPIYSFPFVASPGNPQANLVLGPDGNFYGTTFEGGKGYAGTVFEVTADGVLTLLASFAGTNGSGPEAALTPASDGNFYGTTSGGGGSGKGTVFKMTPDGALTTLYSFTATTSNGHSAYTNSDGATPQADLIPGSDETFYGTTRTGGRGGAGTVFKITANGMLTTLYSFSEVSFIGNLATNSDGANPEAGLALGSDGNFYSATYTGGRNGEGTLFRMTPNGVVTTLVNFANTNGANPQGDLISGPDGHLYGTTQRGGSSNGGEGTVFELTTNGALTTLARFTNGWVPVGGLASGLDGNFYGMTEAGGSDFNGTVFQVTPNGVLTTLYTFAYTNGGFSDGRYPGAGLALGPDGNFYGTTTLGGGNDTESGTIFQVTTNGVLTTLDSLGATNGANPQAGLTAGPDGNFYGTTQQGGSSADGTVFQVTPRGRLTTLYSFSPLIFDGGYMNSDGAYPDTALALGPNGNFYGTTEAGGNSGDGTVFEVTTNGVLTTLVTFVGTNGAAPYAALTLAPDGNFYGTTAGGGSNGQGTVFKMTTDGVLTTLYSFSASTINGINLYTNFDGRGPKAGLTLGPDGNFYGTTQAGGNNGEGTVFQITPSGGLTTLVNFAPLVVGSLANANGTFPLALTLGPDGNFYGITGEGGNSGDGTVFELTTNGVLTTLAAFDCTNGSGPVVGLTLGHDGNFYGTTAAGGSSGDGTVFEVTTNGVVTTLASFTGNNGSDPESGLTLGPDHHFYGTAGRGGNDGGGVIYRLNVPDICGISNDPCSGCATLSLASYPGSANFLYATTNPALPLSQWQLIATNVAGSNGSFQFTDPDTKGVPAKFYHLSTQW